MPTPFANRVLEERYVWGKTKSRNGADALILAVVPLEQELDERFAWSTSETEATTRCSRTGAFVFERLADRITKVSYIIDINVGQGNNTSWLTGKIVTGFLQILSEVQNKFIRNFKTVDKVTRFMFNLFTLSLINILTLPFPN